MITLKKVFDPSEVFFTADTHFGHKGILQYCNRNFSSIEEHDEFIINSWNSRVKNYHTVFHMGDFSFYNIEKAERILQRLNGKIFLVSGAHDKYKQVSRLSFKGIFDILQILVGDTKIVLSHYPFYDWNGRHVGTWNIHGSTHGSYIPNVNLNQKDVGVDVVGYSPISFTALKSLMEQEKLTKELPFNDGFEDVNIVDHLSSISFDD